MFSHLHFCCLNKYFAWVTVMLWSTHQLSHLKVIQIKHIWWGAGKVNCCLFLLSIILNFLCLFPNIHCIDCYIVSKCLKICTILHLSKMYYIQMVKNLSIDDTEWSIVSCACLKKQSKFFPANTKNSSKTIKCHNGLGLHILFALQCSSLKKYIC